MSHKSIVKNLKDLADTISNKKFENIDCNQTRLLIFSTIEMLDNLVLTNDRLRDENTRLHLDVAFYSKSMILNEKK